ncbi:ROK family transcriptional regulator [Microbacterium shaanxiense]
MQKQPSSIAARIVTQLRDAGPATVNGLARSLQVSRTSVENAIGPLTDDGVLSRTTTSGAGVGRPSRSYAFDAGRGCVAGVDVGNASIRVVISDLSGEVLAHQIGAGVSDHPDGASKLAAVVGEVRSTLRTAGIPMAQLRAIGLSLPGIVSESGVVLNSVVIPEWSGVDIGNHLAGSLGVTVAVDNGVRLAAVAEHHLGAAQLVSDVLYLSVGNRVAMALILGGQARRGVHEVAGDIGRLIMPELQAGAGEISWRNGRTAAEVFARARDGDGEAREEIGGFVERLARALAILVMAVDPAKVVVGGGLSQAHDEFLAPLREAVARHLRLSVEIPVVKARLGDEAAAHGALVLAFRKNSYDIYGLEEMGIPPILPWRHHDVTA